MTSPAAPALALIGAGRMGLALMRGWLADPDLAAGGVLAVDPGEDARAAAAALGAQTAETLTPETAEALSTLVLAVKPQAFDAVVADLPPVRPGALVVSVLAGTPLAALTAAFPGAAVVRAMPNTPAALAKGVTVLAPAADVSGALRDRAVGLMGAVGSVETVEDEALMDAVTAVSGSGPAYVFALAEALARAGAEAGLPADLAHRLAAATVAGAGAMLDGPDADPAKLRRAVTSPGGTTAAALEVLTGEEGLDRLLTKAVAAAAARSRALAKP